MASMAQAAATFFSAAALGITFLLLRRQQPRAAAAGPELSSTPLQAPYISGSQARPVTHFTVAHLSTTFPTEATFPSPLSSRAWPRNLNFVGLHDEVVESQILSRAPAGSDGSGGSGGSGGAPAMVRMSEEVRAFVRAGPVERLYWDPRTVRAAIVTCGGLCPGLNTVVREIVMSLHYVYGAREVYGVPNGYNGFYSGAPWQALTPASVSTIHTLGGTVLGSSRGGFDLDKILGALAERGISMLFVVGGDGSHRGALALVKGAAARGMKISIIGLCKTVDCDIPVMDKSFGFDTAVEEAVRPIGCANVEAKAAQGGVGLVKLMGREAGFIAMHASMASRDVNLVLIPEAPWRLKNVLSWLERRLEERSHAVIVVAEGAESMEQKEAAAASAATAVVAKDASGNKVLADVGQYLKEAINKHFKALGKPCSLKYIDPSYIIRSSPPCASDSNLCTNLAHNAVHGAFAGYTGVTVGVVENHYVLLPIPVLCAMPPRVVDINGRPYARMCSATGQPKLDD